MSGNLHYVNRASALEDISFQNQLFTRICVRPPYFALRNIHFENGVFFAEAGAELPRGLALGPMRPGELSRHSAIAGLCAVAMRQRDDQRRYYLATDATFTGFSSLAPYGDTLQFAAEVTEFGKRSAKAFITATYLGERVATLSVLYTVLSASVFERLHAFRRRPTPNSSFRPYPITAIEWRHDKGVSIIPSLPVEMCAGHFDNYPAAPVALLMDQLAQIAERFVERASFISWGEISATRLCWAGHEVKLSVTRLSGNFRETRLYGVIESEGAVAGEMTLVLEH